MRKMRALVAICFMLLVTPILMGADITLVTVTAAKGSLSGNGAWSVDAKAGEKYYGIQFVGYVKGTTNYIGGNGAPAGANWSATVSPIAAGTYNPTQVILFYYDGKNVRQQTPPTKNTTDQVVN